MVRRFDIDKRCRSRDLEQFVVVLFAHRQVAGDAAPRNSLITLMHGTDVCHSHLVSPHSGSRDTIQRLAKVYTVE